MSDIEENIWEGQPNQKEAYRLYAISLFTIIFVVILTIIFVVFWDSYAWRGLAIIPVMLAITFLKWLELRHTSYRLTRQELIIQTGIVIKETHKIALQQIIDWEAINLSAEYGHIIINVKNHRLQRVKLLAISNSSELMELLSEYVLKCKEDLQSA